MILIHGYWRSGYVDHSTSGALGAYVSAVGEEGSRRDAAHSHCVANGECLELDFNWAILDLLKLLSHESNRSDGVICVHSELLQNSPYVLGQIHGKAHHAALRLGCLAANSIFCFGRETDFEVAAIAVNNLPLRNYNTPR